MDKIGIITFTEGYNYGNKLQNYAMLTYLMEFGNLEVYTVDNHVQHEFKYKSIISFLKRCWPSKKHYAYFERQKRFNQFNRKYLHFTKQKLRRTTKLFSEVDLFICGSDQIWNPNYYKCIDPLVGKTIDNKKSVSYAASFGVSDIPEQYKESFKQSLSYLDAVSVREVQGKRICEEFGIKEVQVLVDPTFLLSKSQWKEKIEKPRNFTNESYVLTYYIGEIPKNVNSEIDKYCMEKKLRRIDLNSLNHLEYYSYSPFEFLYLFLNSTIVYTDSFHATIFSIIFEKKFLVSERRVKNEEKMNSRIDTLLVLFELENHRFQDFRGNYDSLNVNNVKIAETIYKEQKRSSDFFMRIIRG